MDRNKMTKINPNVERVEIEKVTKKGYSIQGTHCVLKPTQHETMTATFNQLVDQCTAVGFENKLTLDDHILITINNVTKVTPKVKTFQVGASKTSNSTPEMIELVSKIDALVNEYSDCIINGKAMFLCTDDVPREYSGTFTTRTPNGEDRKEYIKALTVTVKEATKELIS
jgi:hypothetical protein